MNESSWLETSRHGAPRFSPKPVNTYAANGYNVNGHGATPAPVMPDTVFTDEVMKASRILIVDDEVANVRLLERTLSRWGYSNLTSTTTSSEVLGLYQEVKPDLILLDIMMPGLDGYGVMEQLTPHLKGTYLPILVLTADATPQATRKALAAGARDFLTKPFDSTELLLRVYNLLETRYLHSRLEQQNTELEDKVRERTQELEQSQIEVVERLAQAAEFRDDDTGQHTVRVGDMAASIAREMQMDEARISLLRRAAPLHDVGKIGISDDILLKPGKLTDEEFATMKTHTTIGAALLARGQSEMVVLAEIIARTHHERWDGRGYPNQLSGAEIPLAGRIVALADVFDALTNERPYKKAWPQEEAVAEICNQSGKQFDPDVVDAFLRVWRREYSTDASKES